jgi:predicted ester cyclase
MSAEDLKALVRDYIEEMWNQGNLSRADDLLAAHYRRYTVPTAAPLSRDAQKQRIAALRAAFPDMHVTIEDLLVEGDRVACRVSVHGTHQGVFQGIAPTGKQVVVAALDLVRIENGKLVEHWGGPDLFSLLQQLGAVITVK